MNLLILIFLMKSMIRHIQKLRYPFKNSIINKYSTETSPQKPRNRPLTARIKRKVRARDIHSAKTRKTNIRTKDEFEKYVMKIAKRRKKNGNNFIFPPSEALIENNTECTWINLKSKTRNTVLPFAFDKKRRVSLKRPQTAIGRSTSRRSSKERVKRLGQFKMSTLGSTTVSKELGEKVLDLYLTSYKKPMSKTKKKKDEINIQRNFRLIQKPFLEKLHPKMRQVLKKTKLKKILIK
mmetsp:Transcript_1824/g.1612  ORF Transcript_1824/g.1612 Transcript_1824/m.1612 type:complete len:237 (+) Transcript_1824:213-923(+)